MSAAKNTVRIQRMCVAALLCAIAILIPMISPVKIQLGPMSFTLGSHVAIFIAMFILLWIQVVIPVDIVNVIFEYLQMMAQDVFHITADGRFGGIHQVDDPHEPAMGVCGDI